MSRWRVVPARRRGAWLALPARDDLDAGELLLRLDQRGHVLVAQPEQVRGDEALVHGFADDARHRQRFGEMRVVAEVLHAH